MEAEQKQAFQTTRFTQCGRSVLPQAASTMYRDASGKFVLHVLTYKWTHLETGKTGERKVGLPYYENGHMFTSSKPQELMDYWNNELWHYEIVNLERQKGL